jgi:inner membrane protein
VPAGPGLGESGSTRSALVALRHAYADPARVQWTQVFRFGDDGGRAEFARTAWNRPEFGAFRRFSVYTVMSHVEYRAEERQVCAWFYDARFALPNVAPSFRFGSCQHMDDKSWTVERAPGSFAFF